jgi:hypothetical protein
MEVLVNTFEQVDGRYHFGHQGQAQHLLNIEMTGSSRWYELEHIG